MTSNPSQEDGLQPFPDIHPKAEAALPNLQQTEALGILAVEITHEMNNLLTVAFGGIELLERQPLSEQGKRQLARLRWSVQRAARLAEQMLSFSRLNNAQVQIIDVNAVIRNFDRILEQAAGRGIHLVLELGHQPLRACLDPQQLELALLNLVRNACDAMKGQGTLILRTAGPRLDGLNEALTVQVSVSDTGPGMPPDVLQAASTAFFTTKGPGRGTGLGLSMVQRFAASCGGKMTIDSSVGQGTTVHLSFPQA